MGCIETVQHLLSFGLRQNGQGVHCLHRCLFQRVGQSVQCCQQHLTDPFGTDARIDLNIEAEVFASVVIDRKIDRIVGTFLAEQDVHAVDAGPIRCVQLLTAAIVTIVEQAGEQRALGIDTAVLLYFSQRGVLKLQQSGQAVVRLAQRLFDTHFSQRQPQRQGVQEHAQHAVSPFTAGHPPEQHRAENDVVLPGGGLYHAAPGQMEQAGHGDTALL